MTADTILPDQPARDAIERELDVTMMVEAAAGTGKTTSLVGRMAALVRTGACSVDHIAAITFTVKAAGHLREKFQEELERQIATLEAQISSANAQPPASTAQLESELANLRAASTAPVKGFIGTIHAFCARLLRERPVEAGLDPGFEELTAEDAKSWTATFWADYVARKSAEGEPAFARLAEIGRHPGELAELFARLVDYPDVELPRPEIPVPDLSTPLTNVVAYLDRYREWVELHGRPTDDFARMLDGALRILDWIDTARPVDLVRLFEALDKSGKPTQYKWGEDKALKQRAKEFGEDFVSLRENSIAPALRRWREYCYPIFLDVLVPALGEFAALRRREGRLTFQDLLVGARDLLRDFPDVRNYFAARFSRVLVDEFQDTDPIQAEILFYLCGSTNSGGGFQSAAVPPLRGGGFQSAAVPPLCGRGFQSAAVLPLSGRGFQSAAVPPLSGGGFQSAAVPSNDAPPNSPDSSALRAAPSIGMLGHEPPSWRSLTPRPGSLFIVGDPKQAIYRFRRADIETYDAVRNTLEPPVGRVEQLRTNFRSSASVCDHVNRIFRTRFAQANSDDVPQAPHVELAAMHGDLELSGARILRVSGRTVDDVAASEADFVARWISAAVASGLVVRDGDELRPAAWRDFLLIARTTKRLSDYTRALEAVGIPYEVTGGRAFSSSDEIGPTLSLLRAVAEPEDQVAVAALLRGPFFGIDDETLLTFVEAGGRFSYERPGTDPTDARMTAAFELLREARGWSRELTPAAAVGRILERTAIVPWAAAQERGESRAGNLRKLALLAQREAARGLSFAEVVGELRRMMGEEKSEIEELSLEPSRRDVVRVMNLHQAKGLEAPIVFLVDPREEPDFPPSLAVDRSADPPRGWVKLGREKNHKREVWAQPPDWERHAEREKAHEARENERLRYVAATRAGQLLVVSVRDTAKGPDGVWVPLADGLAELEPIGAAAAGATRRKKAKLDPAAAKAEIERRRDASVTPSYAVSSVTKLAHADGATVARAEEGRGRGASWGRVLHRLLEAMMKDPNLDLKRMAANLLRDEEREPAELDEVIRLARAVQQSDLWQQALTADECYVEVPFAIEVDNAPTPTPPNPKSEIRAPKSPLPLPLNPKSEIRDPKSLPPLPLTPKSEIRNPKLIHGTIDLIFKDRDGRWTLIDYKSDDTTNRLDQLVAFYAPQVRAYAALWQRMTNEPVRAGLFFVDGARTEWIDS